MASTRVYWKWEDEETDGEGVGPVIVQHEDGSVDEWADWVRRSVAEAYAAEHDREFHADE